jgi:hypothetical protein
LSWKRAGHGFKREQFGRTLTATKGRLAKLEELTILEKEERAFFRNARQRLLTRTRKGQEFSRIILILN